MGRTTEDDLMMQPLSSYPIVDGLSLCRELRAALKPDEEVTLSSGYSCRLPRYFYRIENRESAMQLITPNFTVAELMIVDCREVRILYKGWPRHVPCAIGLLASSLQTFREKVGQPVYVSANGGYRSPCHRANRELNAHHWASAANIYRIGDTYLTDRSQIEKYGRIAQSVGFQLEPSLSSENPKDHLHVDLQIVSLTPR